MGDRHSKTCECDVQYEVPSFETLARRLRVALLSLSFFRCHEDLRIFGSLGLRKVEISGNSSVLWIASRTHNAYDMHAIGILLCNTLLSTHAEIELH